MAFAARPFIDECIYMPPSPKVEVPDTKVGTFGKYERFTYCCQKGLVDVVENARHVTILSFQLSGMRRLATDISSLCFIAPAIPCLLVCPTRTVFSF